ncbi:putative hydrolase of the alpha/beta superfamily [Sterolibacterium denitrificans]|uniref:Hydrolase of the alpha/beta superfamily n=2 Tax=Sterolibacterium denitrificans TaxID=157592 RepID=A0A7Z7HUV9_9PROT|nr:alpha/beta fold hydrolase [Sterolibacterium denitrificans]KYC29384.1 alpha/beta hydrolase [Sterolibacterium denitrificans]SMB31237.1 putative hydrolase of the alpha/beta superfamily [Sterolibacterium denitrificans]
MTERLLLDGPDGRIEVFVDTLPLPGLRGIALVAHPHPLFGGTADNKVVTTLAKALRGLGYVTLRPNFRGVGASEGSHDQGEAETADLLAVQQYAVQRFGALPTVLAGFSFGAHVATRLARILAERDTPAERLILVGTAAGHVEGARSYDTAAVPADTIVIHGSEDTTVPLANVLAWAEPLELPISLVPGADHFFHRKLHIIRNIIHAAWKR